MSRRSAIPRGDTRPGRTLGVNRAQRTLHVVCEGETEGDYLNLLEAYFGKEMRFHVNPYTRPEGFKPTGAVERAIEVRKSLYRDDRENVWVMFDRDEHFDVEKAVVLARKNKIKVAFSHPSFDLWLWVHFAPGRPTGQGAVVPSSYPSSRGRRIRELRSEGDKRLLSLVRQGALSANLSQAIKLARRLDAGCESGLCDPDRRAADGGREPHDDRCAILKRDPSTGVYVLLESLGFTTA